MAGIEVNSPVAMAPRLAMPQNIFNKTVVYSLVEISFNDFNTRLIL
jgi:hypothetical protein